MKSMIEGQRTVYREALTTASIAANAATWEERNPALLKFWQLYHGEMIVYEDKQVASEMKRLGEVLGPSQPKTLHDPAQPLPVIENANRRIHSLATSMQSSMAKTSTMTYDQFTANQFQYVRE